LARELKIGTVAELRARMSSREWWMWAAYLKQTAAEQQRAVERAQRRANRR
jgi:hypothetical protein